MKLIWLSAFWLGTLALCGCSDPKAIAEFASLADRAARDFAMVAHSVVTTCEVQQYRRGESRGGFDNDERDAKACASSVAAEKALLNAHAVVEEYIATLKLLANDNILITNVGEVTKESQTLLRMSDAQVKSIGGLANAISKAMTEGYRRREMTKMIREADSGLQATVIVLSEVIEKQIETKFRLAEDAVKAYYIDGLLPQKDPAHETIASRQWIQQGEREIAALREKKQAVLAYRKMLQKIAVGHAKLNEAAGNWRSPSLATFLFKTAGELRSEQAKVEKAFSK